MALHREHPLRSIHRVEMQSPAENGLVLLNVRRGNTQLELGREELRELLKKLATVKHAVQYRILRQMPVLYVAAHAS